MTSWKLVEAIPEAVSAEIRPSSKTNNSGSQFGNRGQGGRGRCISYLLYRITLYIFIYLNIDLIFPKPIIKAGHHSMVEGEEGTGAMVVDCIKDITSCPRRIETILRI